MEVAGLDYGNWIRRRLLLILGLATLAAAALALIPAGAVYRTILTIVFISCLLSFLFPLYAYFMFSERGGRFQARLYDSIVQSLGSNLSGKYLDIGSGNGVLAIKVAMHNPRAEVLGIDFWGAKWEYSKAKCEQNALTAKVADRVRFQKGDAAALDFASEEFDGAVSNLTFHEVSSASDKRAVLNEALRVIKPRGIFVFVDYFLESKYYGPFPEFRDYLVNIGLSEVQIRPLHDVMAVPRLLRHPRALGKVAIISGKR